MMLIFASLQLFTVVKCCREDRKLIKGLNIPLVKDHQIIEDCTDTAKSATRRSIHSDQKKNSNK